MNSKFVHEKFRSGNVIVYHIPCVTSTHARTYDSFDCKHWLNVLSKSKVMENFVEPGAVRHGNFINYYDFNSAPDRLNLLPIDANYWSTAADQPSEPYLVLDVGCNAGNFTQLLYEFLAQMKPNQNVIVLGIDIDATLIDRAIEANQHRQNVFYECCNIMGDDDNDSRRITNHLKNYGKTRFDVVCCLSITMWIHLNNGDDGLKRFLDLSTEFCEILVIEPQPWKCYQNAVRRMKRAGDEHTFPLYRNLTIRNTVETFIKDYVKNEKQLDICFESDPTKWKRTICLYRRKVDENKKQTDF